MAQLKGLKIQIIDILLDRGQLDMVSMMLKILEVTPQELDALINQSKKANKPSIFWHACDRENVELFSHVLSFYRSTSRSHLVHNHVCKALAPDGTTPLAIALGRLNSGLVGKLRQFVQDYFNEKGCNCQSLRKVFEDLMEYHNIGWVSVHKAFYDNWSVSQVSRSREQPKFRYRYPNAGWPLSPYPYVHPDSEYSRSLNHGVQQRILELGSKEKITTQDCKQYILGEFCIASPQGTWALGDDLILHSCTHDTDSR